ncbi:glutathione S-transferase 2 [Folsomia candida]|uniref:Glutathione S-transferase 2 n=1 Tax=Folsomia candida TaxID=158441 RepID=A0A226EMA9_FOLCA|nr:glutathione S-transferase 2 [Folsomia candida]OXA58430.1 Glutathione S-transferase 2 [Folsomia candida]
MQDVRLVYFDIRGLAEPIRWMLTIAGIGFTDDRIALTAWMTKKKNTFENIMKRRTSASDTAAALGLKKQFVGQLPILCLGDDFVLTQPLCVLRFLAKKCGFNGETEMEEARAEEISDLVYDLRTRAVEYEGKAFKSQTPDIVCHTVFRDLRGAPESNEKTKMLEDFRTMFLPLYFKKFNSLLEMSAGEWIAGPNLTYGDFVLVNFLDIAEDMVDPNCLDEFPKLRQLKESVLQIPEIQQWRKLQEQKNLISYVEKN